MSPMGLYPLQPEKCITRYGRIAPAEDIAESVVAYIFAPDILKELSAEKFAILQSQDISEDPLQRDPIISVERIPEEKIKLPEAKPPTITYYVKEE